MQDPESDSSQDLVDVVGVLDDRTSSSGAPWCLPEDGKKLRQIFEKRGEALNGVIQQAVRLLRLMHRADPLGYEFFLYRDGFWPLREGQFAGRFRRAFETGRLKGIARLEANGSVTLLEAEMNGKNKQFNLSFAQMPLIAACIDVIGNMLLKGGDRLGVRCADVMQPTCRRTALDMGKEIAQVVQEWLKPRLAPQHGQRQHGKIWEYHKRVLKKHDVDRAPNHEDVDDDFIANFWIFCGSAEKLDGFRLFRNSARKVVAYKFALQMAEREWQLSDARSTSVQDGDLAIDSVDLDRLVVPSPDGEPLADFNPLAELMSEEWVSPLEILLTPPCNRVKWLSSGTGKSKAKGGKKRSQESGGLVMLGQVVGVSASDGNKNVAPSIFCGQPPDPGLFRTVLRFACFGVMQRKLSRFEPGGKGNVEENEIDTGNYERFAALYKEQVNNIFKTMGAAAWSLLKREMDEGVYLSTYMMPDESKAALYSVAGSNVIQFNRKVEYDGKFQLALNSNQGLVVKKALKSCYGKVNREGFREADDADPAYGEALAEGAVAMATLHQSAAHFADWCKKHDLALFFKEDLAIFEPRLRKMYGEYGREATGETVASVRLEDHLGTGS